MFSICEHSRIRPDFPVRQLSVNLCSVLYNFHYVTVHTWVLQLYLACVVCWWASVWAWDADRIHRLLPWMRKADDSRGESYPSISYCCFIYVDTEQYWYITGETFENPCTALPSIRNPSLEKDTRSHGMVVGSRKEEKGGKRKRVNISSFHRDSAYTASRLITAINRRTVYSLIDPSIGFDI